VCRAGAAVIDAGLKSPKGVRGRYCGQRTDAFAQGLPSETLAERPDVILSLNWMLGGDANAHGNLASRPLGLRSDVPAP
jgi:hypothetical protein